MFGVDYAFFPHPKITDLEAHGVKFAGRYVSPSAASDASGKNLLAGEKHDLLAAGIDIILYGESTAGRMKDGHAAGVSDAKHAAAVIPALGLDGIVVYWAADWDVSAAEQAAVHAFLDGAGSVLGPDQTGLYGGFWTVHRALNAGKVKMAVQTRAWSTFTSSIPMPDHAVKWEVGGHTYFADSRAVVRQGLISTIGAASCDLLRSQAADFGQYPRPVPPPVGPFRHVVPAGNLDSMAKMAAARGTTVDHLAELAVANLNAVNLAVFQSYVVLAEAMAAAGMPAPAMPAGLVYFTTHQ